MAEHGLGRLPSGGLDGAPLQGTMTGQSQGQPARIVGDYFVTQQIGAGSFAVVWKGRHKETGREVAIKEIATEKLNKKLRESLESEIAILEKANHPNIIHLIEIVKHPDRIFLILEYCAGGDLSEYIRRNGRVPENIARHFLRQLGAGLQVLRSNNLIHRDLKPQNLLLLTKDKNAVLKIADFGFARSLQPQNLAETLCGSPLYMAPEILQFQKYDAKADLWSVGAILFELVTGRPPFGGANHVQLLRNIERNDARIPDGVASSLSDACISMIRLLLRRNPVERLSFEEFFHHPFLDLPKRRSAPESDPPATSSTLDPQTLPSKAKPGAQRSEGVRQGTAGIAAMKSPPPLSSSPFLQEGATRGRSMSSGGAEYALKHGGRDWDSKGPGGSLGGGATVGGMEEIGPNQVPSSRGSSDRNAQRTVAAELAQKGRRSTDSMEGIEREYVVIHGPLQASSEMGQESGPVPKPTSVPPSIQPPPLDVGIGTRVGSAEAASEGSRGRLHDFRDDTLQPPTPQARISSLHRCARLITELAIDKLDIEQRLEALSLHLLCLAAWREAITVCHAWAETLDGDDVDPANLPCPDSPLPGSLSSQRMLFDMGPEAACASVEREFLLAVERAEAVAQELGAEREAEVPDAMELVFQAALAVGRAGAVEELMNNVSNAAVAYKKAAALFHFLLAEAPSLHTTSREPLVLSPADSQRLRRYHDALMARLAHCTEQRLLQQQQKQQQKAGFGLHA